MKREKQTRVKGGYVGNTGYFQSGHTVSLSNRFNEAVFGCQFMTREKLGRLLRQKKGGFARHRFWRTKDGAIRYRSRSPLDGIYTITPRMVKRLERWAASY